MTDAGTRDTGTRVPLTGRPRRIAVRMEQAWTAPAFHLTVMLDADDLERAREVEPSATLTDVLLLRCARTLVDHRDLNSHYDAAGPAVVRFDDVNLGIAVATPKGLVVPVLHALQDCSLGEIAQRRRELVGRTRAGQVTIDDLEGGTFTISNLGMFGIPRFDAILNVPQVAILAAGAVVTVPALRGGDLVERRVLEVTLTCDHRAVDGASGAAFLQQLAQGAAA